MPCELCIGHGSGDFSSGSDMVAEVSVENVLSLSRGFLCPSSSRALLVCRPCVDRIQAAGNILSLWKGKLDLVVSHRNGGSPTSVINGDRMEMDGQSCEVSPRDLPAIPPMQSPASGYGFDPNLKYPPIKSSSSGFSLDSGITFDSDSNGEFFEAEDVSRPSTAFASAEEDDAGSPIRSHPNFGGENPFLSPAMSQGFPSNGDSPPQAHSPGFTTAVSPHSNDNITAVTASNSSSSNRFSPSTCAPSSFNTSMGLPHSSFPTNSFYSPSLSSATSYVVESQPAMSPPLSASHTPPPSASQTTPPPSAMTPPPGFSPVMSPNSGESLPFPSQISIAASSDGALSTAETSPASTSSMATLMDPAMMSAARQGLRLAAPPLLTSMSPQGLSSLTTQQLAALSAQQPALTSNRLRSSPSTYHSGLNAFGTNYSDSKTSLFSLKECRLGLDSFTPYLQPSSLLYGTGNNIPRPRPIQKSLVELDVDLRQDEDSDEKGEYVDYTSSLLHLRPSSLSSSRRGCGFCLSNGERQRECMSHRLKNPETNIVECPQLRKFICPLCQATGDFAHTQGYCPLNDADIPTVKHLKKKRSSAGRLAGGKNIRPENSGLPAGLAGLPGVQAGGNGSLGVVDPSIIAIGPKGGRRN